MSGFKDDECDLYAVALGESYAPKTCTTAKNTAENVPNQPSSSSDFPPKYIALFHELLVGSRSQIERLETENAELKKNLKNALASGGVVVCPNCTHQFIDRHCLLRPRSMKKMRARNCVELEFKNPDDLQSWLYLNQLETNNDGLPTVMNVKKTANTAKSLKEVGSLLPELVEKRRDEMKRQKKSPVLNISYSTKDKKAGGTPKNTRDVSKGSVYEDCREARAFKKEKCDEKARRSEIPNRLENGRRNRIEQEFNNKQKDDTASKSTEKKRKLSRDPAAKDELVRKISKKHPISERIQFPNSKKPIDERSTTIKNNASTNGFLVRPLSESVENSLIEAHKNVESSAKLRKDDPDTKSQVKSSIKHISGCSSTSSTVSQSECNNMTETIAEGTIEYRQSVKKAPIVWEKQTEELEHIESSSSKRENHFEFKLNVHRRNPDSVPRNGHNSRFIASKPEDRSSKPKYTFVPTALKNSLQLTETNGIKTNATAANLVDLNNKRQNMVVAMESEALPLNHEVMLKVSGTSEKNCWNIIAVKKSASVLDHIKKRALERGTFTRNWPENIIVLSGDTLQEVPSTSTVQLGNTVKDTDLTSVYKIENIEIAESLKRIGVSDEGIAVLKTKLKYTTDALNTQITREILGCDSKQLEGSIDVLKLPSLKTNDFETKLSSTPPTKLNESFKDLEDEDALSEFFPDLASSKFKPTLETTYRPSSAESLGSMADQEEEELTCLIRKDSAVPPSADSLLDVNDYEKSIISVESKDEPRMFDKNQYEDSQCDWKEFCLEDVDDEVDETTRERKLSEMDKVAEDIGGSMDWLNDFEPVENEEEESEVSNSRKNVIKREEGEFENKDMKFPENHRSETVPLEMKSEFRLSDGEDLIFPMTSTPKREDSNDGVYDSTDEHLNLRGRSDSYVNELDWNYGTDIEEEEGGDRENCDETIIDNKKGQNEITNDKVNTSLEEGELSDDIGIEESENVREIKDSQVPMRERIQYVNQSDQTAISGEEGANYSRTRTQRESRRRAHRRRSEDNRERGYKHDNRPETYRSLLKRRN